MSSSDAFLKEKAILQKEIEERFDRVNIKMQQLNRHLHSCEPMRSHYEDMAGMWGKLYQGMPGKPDEEIVGKDATSESAMGEEATS
ncbi:DASH complex subunit Dad1p [Diutina catenulata]